MESFFAQMPDDLASAQWYRSSSGRQVHTMTWSDGREVVTVGLAGLRLDLSIGYRNFVTDNIGGTDQMSWYVDSANIPALLDFEITSQEFVDRSVVIVNDNRVEVNLSDQG